ncbi:hypothetical protein [Dapis sp. BLCC M172]|uniref:hypothetical protein n=1 Tax=Dapis sp. BLCC M172 TaxID=2975281 RepID=UPI003CF43662
MRVFRQLINFLIWRNRVVGDLNNSGKTRILQEETDDEYCQENSLTKSGWWDDNC